MVRPHCKVVLTNCMLFIALKIIFKNALSSNQHYGMIKKTKMTPNRPEWKNIMYADYFINKYILKLYTNKYWTMTYKKTGFPLYYNINLHISLPASAVYSSARHPVWSMSQQCSHIYRTQYLASTAHILPCDIHIWKFISILHLKSIIEKNEA